MTRQQGLHGIAASGAIAQICAQGDYDRMALLVVPRFQLFGDKPPDVLGLQFIGGHRPTSELLDQQPVNDAQPPARVAAARPRASRMCAS